MQVSLDVLRLEAERRRRLAERSGAALADVALLQRSYRAFLRASWPVIEPGTPLVDGWYVDALADHCEAWARGEIKALMIHIRPRAGKTNIVSVLLGGWIWAWRPAARLLWASYSRERRDEDSRRTRALMASEWYQERWPRPLASDQRVKHRFALSSGGYRYSAIYGSGATGDGGDYLGLDDPQCGADQYSPTELERDHRWYYETWQTRRNQGTDTPELICMQRLGVDDLAARLRYDDPGRWEALALQTRRTVIQTATYWREQTSVELPLIDTALSRDGRFEDPREVGETLSDRDDADELTAMEKAQPSVYHAQMQQTPVRRAAEGARINVFDRDRHLRSFAQRMGCATLREAIASALRQGWVPSLGFDHGLDAGRQQARLILWSDDAQELWALTGYANPERQTVLQDAMAIRAELLDANGIPIRRVQASRGDVGNLGKGAAGGSAGSINRELSACVYPAGHERAGQPVLGTPIITAMKRAISEEEIILNEGFGSGAVFLDTSAESLAVGLENWTGDEAYKDVVDAFRYAANPHLRRWRALRPGMSGVSTG